jgi:cytochrome c biogenesis protein CcmG/thiol:disulfide interchange protein DsbE
MTMEKSEPVEEKNQRRLPGWVFVLALALLVGFLAIIGGSLNKKTAAPVKIGDPIPEFTLTSFSGETFHSTDLKGKVVLLNFWASWCTTCEDEAAALENVWKEMQPGGKVLFLGVDWADTEPEALAYLEKFGITYPSGPDLGTKVSQLFRITGVPETYVFDASGRLAAVTIGPFESEAEIRSLINGLLPEG